MRGILLVFPHDMGTIDSGIKARVSALLRYWHEREFVVDQVSFLECENLKDFGNSNPYIRKRFNLPMPHSKEGLLAKARRVMGFKKKESDPTTIPNWVSDEARKSFNEIIRTMQYECLVISYLYWDQLSREVPEGIRRIAMVEDLLSLNIGVKREVNRYACLQDEFSRLCRYDRSMFISPDEEYLYSRLGGGTNSVLVPPFLDQVAVEDTEKEFDLLFFGSINRFNVEGLAWFVEHVLPRLPKSTRLLVAGGVARTVDKHLSIETLERVVDTNELYSRTRISICPLLGGTGVKIKVLESLASGVPVVGTSWASIGLLSKVANGCLIADTIEAFSDAIVSLIADETKRKELSAQALSYIASAHSTERAYSTLDSVFRQ